ncbi:TetR/AcrR family transcriptional regulator [Streptomyces sp. VB1]|uniref:TetR/AcrR family transcriptional regulator n=1 Tax=Streptomyces sp. VB1 TaxID=2986803 RepID=UPI002241AE54|nr:TetR family transcriptional regulator [Streptomyces sp. VB1]UZI27283.1 TetR family transcriptional regulator [Streptomyces sp. VB1]
MAGVRLNVAERREELLRATVGQVEARGVSSVRIADVASVLGVSNALVLYHFSTKEKLVVAAFAYAAEADLEDPRSAAWRLTALLDGMAVQTTPYAGPLSRATMLRWTDEALARELGIGLAELTGPPAAEPYGADRSATG